MAAMDCNSPSAESYRRGCRCDGCRAAEHERYLKRRYETDTELPDVSTDGSSIESLVRSELEQRDLDPEDAIAQRLAGLALVNAELLDVARASKKWHLLAAAQRSLLDALDRLNTHLLGLPPDDQLTAFVNSLRRPGDPSLIRNESE